MWSVLKFGVTTSLEILFSNAGKWWTHTKGKVEFFKKLFDCEKKHWHFFKRFFALTAKGKANFKSHFSCFIVVVTVRPRTALWLSAAAVHILLLKFSYIVLSSSLKLFVFLFHLYDSHLTRKVICLYADVKIIYKVWRQFQIFLDMMNCLCYCKWK